MGREYDAAGEYLLIHGFNAGDTIPAEEVQILLANFYNENLDVIGARYGQWWRRTVSHVRQETGT